MLRLKNITPRVPVENLERTLNFYSGLLGFTVDVCWPVDGPTFAIMNRDQVSIGFYVPDECRPAKAIGQAEFYIETEEAKRLHDELKDHVAIEWGPEVYWYGRREFAIRDPDGYLIIFTEETNDPVTCGETL